MMCALVYKSFDIVQTQKNIVKILKLAPDTERTYDIHI